MAYFRAPSFASAYSSPISFFSDRPFSSPQASQSKPTGSYSSRRINRFFCLPDYSCSWLSCLWIRNRLKKDERSYSRKLSPSLRRWYSWSSTEAAGDATRFQDVLSYSQAVSDRYSVTKESLCSLTGHEIPCSGRRVLFGSWRSNSLPPMANSTQVASETILTRQSLTMQNCGPDESPCISPQSQSVDGFRSSDGLGLDFRLVQAKETVVDNSHDNAFRCSPILPQTSLIIRSSPEVNLERSCALTSNETSKIPRLTVLERSTSKFSSLESLAVEENHSECELTTKPCEESKYKRQLQENTCLARTRSTSHSHISIYDCSQESLHSNKSEMNVYKPGLASTLPSGQRSENSKAGKQEIIMLVQSKPIEVPADRTFTKYTRRSSIEERTVVPLTGKFHPSKIKQNPDGSQERSQLPLPIKKCRRDLGFREMSTSGDQRVFGKDNETLEKGKDHCLTSRPFFESDKASEVDTPGTRSLMALIDTPDLIGDISFGSLERDLKIVGNLPRRRRSQKTPSKKCSRFNYDLPHSPTNIPRLPLPKPPTNYSTLPTVFDFIQLATNGYNRYLTLPTSHRCPHHAYPTQIFPQQRCQYSHQAHFFPYSPQKGRHLLTRRSCSGIPCPTWRFPPSATPQPQTLFSRSQQRSPFSSPRLLRGRSCRS